MSAPRVVGGCLLGAAALLAPCLASCLIERLPAQRLPPRIVVITTDQGAGAAAGCVAAGALEVLHGGVPTGARAVVRMTAKASEAVPLAALQDAMAAKAAPRCVHGMSVLRAIAPDGARGVLEATAVAWARPEPSRGAGGGAEEDPDAGPDGR